MEGVSEMGAYQRGESSEPSFVRLLFEQGERCESRSTGRESPQAMHRGGVS